MQIIHPIKPKEETIKYLKGEKLIFLDIDGVLNSEHFDCGIYQDIVETSTDENYKHHMFCPNLVNNLNMITDATNAKIVISSSWRFSFDTLEELIYFLKECNITGEVIGRTFVLKYDDRCLDSDSVPRGNEIYSFMKHFEFKGNYVILDDDDDMLYYQRNNFFVADREYGLTYSIAKDVIKFLKGE